MMRQARRSSAIKHDTVRCGFPSRRSYVAPSPRSRSAAKRPRKELTYCPTYGFKPFVIYTKDLTPALFCCLEKSQPDSKNWNGWQVVNVAPGGYWTDLQHHQRTELRMSSGVSFDSRSARRLPAMAAAGRPKTSHLLSAQSERRFRLNSHERP